MSAYLKWNEITIQDFPESYITSLYQEGYLFGRHGKGKIYQTRSVRIDLSQFELSSENRRILRKTEDIDLRVVSLPYETYHWSIGKMAKDFYTEKFGDGTFSANKVKELMTDNEKSNFNRLFTYSPYQGELEGVERSEEETSISKEMYTHVNPQKDSTLPKQESNPLGYCIALETNDIIHYSYPFYNLETSSKNMGMGMMIRAVQYAKDAGKKYLYLGSAQRPSDTYKMQFRGLEWFDGEGWKSDLDELKRILEL